MKQTYNRRLVFWTACLGMLLFGIGLIMLGSVLPDLRERHSLNAVEAGTLLSLLPFGIIFGSLLFGPVCDRYGYRALLAVSALLMFAGFEGLAFTRTTGILKLSVFLFGLGGGAINGATNAVVADISTTGKGAALSILGVFFGIGALGMPLLLSLLMAKFDFQVIVAATGVLALAAAVLFAFVRFPAAKQAEGISMKQVGSLFRDVTLLLIAFFLFFQSSFEGLINNWTTTYLMDRVAAPQEVALMGLSAFVAGMTVARLLVGSVLRNLPERQLLYISLGVTFAALLLFSLSRSTVPAVAGLFLLGAGLAAGFPTMLGIVGNRYPDLSGTAFSFVLVIGLVGNMIVNYLMGIVTENAGIKHLTTFTYAELAILVVMATAIFGRLKMNK
ncbi:MAG TPA: MFS transporter [Bacteroidales bacterium]|jgi:FHS family glucose/mannose:H+ symporter-like MFS transporter|nr:MFS transporter [Bacteroidales bacterium]MDI9534063.1 MFS transporter [Bacteroidota bacterium]OPZ57296.1 MAG: putative metabolite transport protein CsbC [Bacteroidetes bacterium ADurb.BinA012]MZQ78774.1 MFS transporter [Bacteroidales bacterium]HHU99949.1 MFS transporter [Bacteroidales bacterium]